VLIKKKGERIMENENEFNAVETTSQLIKEYRTYKKMFNNPDINNGGDRFVFERDIFIDGVKKIYIHPRHTGRIKSVINDIFNEIKTELKIRESRLRNGN
jgi:hypothetical protein